MSASEMRPRQASAPMNIFAKNQPATPMCSRYVELTLTDFAHIVIGFTEDVEL